LKRLNISNTLGQFLLALFAISVIAPIAWVLITSFKNNTELFSSPWSVPTKPKWENYPVALETAQVTKRLLNSLIATVGTLIILIPISAMAAYVLAKYPFKGASAIKFLFRSGLMFPNFLVIIPLFLMFTSLHLTNTLYGLILAYVAYSLAFSVFVLGGFFEALPNELIEASMLDGCSHSQTFWRVMLPLAKPGVLVVTLFNAIGLWNEFPLAFVLIPTKSPYETVPVGLRTMTMNQQYTADYGPMFAATVSFMIPIMIVYILFRKRIQETMLAGAIKG
jgi:N-acetylglucosamine transport system permease protein